MRFKFYIPLLLLTLGSCASKQKVSVIDIPAAQKVQAEATNYFKSRNSIFFDFNKYEIRGEGLVRVEKLIRELSGKDAAKISMGGR